MLYNTVMTPLPATSANDLIGELNELRSEGYFLQKNSFRWMQIKAKLQKLLDANPASGWHVSGIFHAATGDVAEMERAFQNAIHLDSGVNIKRNFFSSYVSLGFASKALEIYRMIASPELGVFSHTFQGAMTMGAFQVATENVEKAKMMGIDLSALPVKIVAESSALLKRLGISDDEVAQHIDAAGAVMRANNQFAMRVPHLIVNDIDGVSSGVTLVMLMDADAKRIFSYNIELAEMEMEMSVQKNAAFDVVFSALQ